MERHVEERFERIEASLVETSARLAESAVNVCSIRFFIGFPFVENKLTVCHLIFLIGDQSPANLFPVQ